MSFFEIPGLWIIAPIIIVIGTDAIFLILLAMWSLGKRVGVPWKEIGVGLLWGIGIALVAIIGLVVTVVTYKLSDANIDIIILALEIYIMIPTIPILVAIGTKGRNIWDRIHTGIGALITLIGIIVILSVIAFVLALFFGIFDLFMGMADGNVCGATICMGIFIFMVIGALSTQGSSAASGGWELIALIFGRKK